jgi:hypothetical protein
MHVQTIFLFIFRESSYPTHLFSWRCLLLLPPPPPSSSAGRVLVVEKEKVDMIRVITGGFVSPHWWGGSVDMRVVERPTDAVATGNFPQNPVREIHFLFVFSRIRLG